MPTKRTLADSDPALSQEVVNEQNREKTEKEPTDLELAKTEYIKKVTRELRREAGDEDVTDYISLVLVNRLDEKLSEFPEEERVEFFELSFGVSGLGIIAPESGGRAVMMQEAIYGDVFKNKGTHFPELLKELLRAKTLARAFNVRSSPHLVDYLLVYSQVLKSSDKDLSSSDRVHFQGMINGADIQERMAEAYELDQELFVDLVMVLARRASGKELGQGFDKVGEGRGGYDNYGVNIKISKGKDGQFPYREGHRSEDIALAKKRISLLENFKVGVGKVETYQDLNSQIVELRGSLNTLESQKGGLSAQVADLEVQNKNLGEQNQLLATRLDMADKNLAEAQNQERNRAAAFAGTLDQIRAAAQGAGVFDKAKVLKHIMEIIDQAGQ